MTSVDMEYRDELAIVTLNRGVTNALDLQLVNQLAENLLKVKDDPDVKGLVLRSSNDKFFSIGFDIPQLFELSREDFMLFYHTYNQVCINLYTLPKPTIAAITGHAIAGGCILSLCCDYRFIADGKKSMGLNEIKLGVPVPYPGDCILRQMVNHGNASEIMSMGEFYQPKELLGMGMVDLVLPLELVLPKAIAKSKQLGAMPSKAFEIIKRNRVESVEAQIQKHLAEKEELFMECWYSHEARALLREAIKKF